MKRIIYVSIGIILSLSLLLSACGGTKTTPPTTTSAPTTATTAPATTAPTTAAPTTTAPGTTAPTTTAPAATTPAEGQPVYGGVFKQALRVGPATPLGYPAESAPDAMALFAPALERLVRVRGGGIIEPQLATAWEIAKDGKSMTLKLRQGVKFHDNTDFNADAVKWNFDLIIAAKKAPNFTSVDVIDPYTVRINILGYQNTVLTSLASGSFAIISPTSFNKNGLEWTRLNPVGTGPFRFVAYERDSKLTYTRNPNYWDKTKPYLDGLEWVVIADETVRKLAFIKGDLHRFDATGLIARELLDQKYNSYSEAGGTYVLVPDSKNPDSPWSNLKVRQAASHAINREALAKGLGFGLMAPAYQIYPGYPAAFIPGLAVQEYNPAKAKLLLDQAGYPNGFKTTIHTFVRVIPRDYITAIAKMFTDVGINTTPDFPEAGKYDDYRYNGWKNALLGHGLASFDNFNTAFNFYFGAMSFPSVRTPPGYTDAVNATLATEAFDPKAFQAVVKLMHDDLMAIPYVEETVVSLYNKGANDPGIKLYGRLTFIHDMAWIDPKAK